MKLKLHDLNTKKKSSSDNQQFKFSSIPCAVHAASFCFITFIFIIIRCFFVNGMENDFCFFFKYIFNIKISFRRQSHSENYHNRIHTTTLMGDTFSFRKLLYVICSYIALHKRSSVDQGLLFLYSFQTWKLCSFRVKSTCIGA